MRTVALINPNSSTATTATLTAIAQQALGPGYQVHGITARTGPALIQTEAALATPHTRSSRSLDNSSPTRPRPTP
jgi:Asp/Glu/hydantoin racemase